jgi:hypothetical protein
MLSSFIDINENISVSSLLQKKLMFGYTLEYYSVIKNELTSFAEKWIELDIIMLSKLR